jgi:membrane-associated phospholipid phosphatase
MEGIMGTAAVILGLLLRFGLPILVTVFFVWLLRRLDQRWQREGAQAEVVIPDEIRLFSTLRCWILNDCTPEQRENCPAFVEALRPCWQVHRNGNGSMKEECLACQVFKTAPIPVPA